jgi:hypothetical protein
VPAEDIPKSKWVGTGEKMEVLWDVNPDKLLIRSKMRIFEF